MNQPNVIFIVDVQALMLFELFENVRPVTGDLHLNVYPQTFNPGIMDTSILEVLSKC